MYVVNKQENKLERLRQCSFSELGFRERQHLQEWVASDPRFVGEELLIIQKEFAGFSETNERLDLLALDKDGNIVIIENKLDDSGRDVTWQALKYASYCSSLTKDQIRSIYQRYLDTTSPGAIAEEQLSAFFENAEYEEMELNAGVTQRVILIAANFRKEVTSTVLWLLNYGLRVQCFRVSAYALGNELVLSAEQIIPMKEAEDYIVSMGAKNQESASIRAEQTTRHGVRKQFWAQTLAGMKGRTELFGNVNASKDSWISTGAGISGIAYALVATKHVVRAELYIQRTREESSRIFDLVAAERQSVENEFGGPLGWEREVGERGARIKAETSANIYDSEEWPRMADFLTDSVIRLHRATSARVQRAARAVLSSRSDSPVDTPVTGAFLVHEAES